MTVVINGTTGITTPGLSNSSTTTNTGNVTNSGTVTNASTISVGNATPSSSGAGITFPATLNASTDANTLDDYEEGSWTATVQNQAGNQSVSLGSQSYVKIGRMVYININAYATSVSAITATNQMFIRGLPFSVANQQGGGCYAGSVMSQYGSNIVSLIDIGSNEAPLYTQGDATNHTPFSRNSWGGASTITFRLSFCYMAAS